MPSVPKGISQCRPPKTCAASDGQAARSTEGMLNEWHDGNLILEARMSRRSISLLVGLYFLAALALSVFRVASNPFFSGWSAVTLGQIIGGALLLLAVAGLPALLTWVFFRFRTSHAQWPMLAGPLSVLRSPSLLKWASGSSAMCKFPCWRKTWPSRTQNSAVSTVSAQASTGVRLASPIVRFQFIVAASPR